MAALASRRRCNPDCWQREATSVQNPAPAGPDETTNCIDVMHILVVAFHIHPPPSRCATACRPGVIMRTMMSPDDGLRALHLSAAPVDVWCGMSSASFGVGRRRSSEQDDWPGSPRRPRHRARAKSAISPRSMDALRGWAVDRPPVTHRVSPARKAVLGRANPAPVRVARLY